MIAGELTLLLGELTLKFEMSKRLDKNYESTTTSESEAGKQSINDQYEQLIREHLAPIYEIYGKELPENCLGELIGDYKDGGSYVITEKDIQPEQLALRTQEMLRNALPIKRRSSRDNSKLQLTPADLFSPEESEGVWVQTYTSSSTSKRETETQTSEEDFSEENSDSLFGKYLMMDNEKLLNKRPLLLDVDDFVNYLVEYSSNAPESDVPSKPNLNVRDVMINLRRNPKFINFLDRINGQMKANANNEIITNHDLLLEMVTDQCKDELIGILKEVIRNESISELDYGDFNPTLLDSIPEEDSEELLELLSRGSTLNAKQISQFKEQQKAVEKWLAASLDNLAVYAQQQNASTCAKISDSQGTLLPTSKEELNRAILDAENNLKLLMEDEVPENRPDLEKAERALLNAETNLQRLIEEAVAASEQPERAEKASLIRMPVSSEETFVISEGPTVGEGPTEKDSLEADSMKELERRLPIDGQPQVVEPVVSQLAKQPPSLTEFSQPLSSTQLEQSPSQTEFSQPLGSTQSDQSPSLTEFSQPLSSAQLDQPPHLTESSQPLSSTRLDQSSSQTEFSRPMGETTSGEIDKRQPATDEIVQLKQQPLLVESRPAPEQLQPSSEQLQQSPDQLQQSPDQFGQNEIVLRNKSKEEPTPSKNRNSLEVPNTFVRLALSLDEASDDENEASNRKKLEKTHSLPEDEFSRKTLSDFVESKDQRNPHITNLDLSQIEQPELFVQEEVLNSLRQAPKRPKLQYQFASEDDLMADNDLNDNFDDTLGGQGLGAGLEPDDSFEIGLEYDPMQDSIFENLNLMETIEESFDEDDASNQDQQGDLRYAAQQQQLDNLQQQLFDQQEQELALRDEMQQQQQMFANELIELQREFENVYANQQEQYFEELARVNQENLEAKLEMLLNQSQQLNLPADQAEFVQNQENFNQLQSLVERLTSLPAGTAPEQEAISVSQVGAQEQLAEMQDQPGAIEQRPVEVSQEHQGHLKLAQKSLSDSLSDDKEKSTSSDTSVITEILNDSFTRRQQELLGSSTKSDNILTSESVQSAGSLEVEPSSVQPVSSLEEESQRKSEEVPSRDEPSKGRQDELLELSSKPERSLRDEPSKGEIPEKLEKSGRDGELSNVEQKRPSIESSKDKPPKPPKAKKAGAQEPAGYDMRDVARAAFDFQNEEELEEIDLGDDRQMIGKTESIDLEDNLEMIEHIALTLEQLVSEAKPPSGKAKSGQPIKIIKPSLMEEIAKTLDELLTEAKQVLGDNQITLSSQKLNKTSKQEVIKSITSTLENLLSIDDSTDPVSAKQLEAKNAKKNLIQNITKSLGNLLTDQPQPSRLSFFSKQQRSFDHEPKLNTIITRSLENLLTLSNIEISSSLRKSKKPSVIESITRTLENLFTRSQVELEEPIDQCSCQIVLDNKKSEYTSLPIKSSQIVLDNQKSEYRSLPKSQSIDEDRRSDRVKGDHTKPPMDHSPEIEKGDSRVEEPKDARLSMKDDSISIKSEDQPDKPVAPKRTKKLKISTNEDTLSQKSLEPTSLITVMSPDVVEESRVLLPELQADVEMIEGDLRSPTESIESPIEPSVKSPIESSERPSKPQKYADSKSIDVEMISDAEQFDRVELESGKQSVEDDSLRLTEFVEKQSTPANVCTTESSDLLKTDYSHPKGSDLKAKTQPTVSISKTSDPVKTDFVKSNYLKPLAKPQPQPIVSVSKTSDPVKTDFVKSSYLKPLEKPLPIVSVSKTSDLVKTDYVKSSYLKPLAKPQTPPIVLVTKTSDLVKTDYVKSSYLKPLPQPIVSVSKLTNLIKTEYFYVPREAIEKDKSEPSDEIELEKVALDQQQDGESKEDGDKKQPRKKLKLRMPLSRKETVLVRQSQVDDDDQQKDVSDSFEVRLDSSDEESTSADTLVRVKRKPVDRPQVTTEEGAELDLTGDRKSSVQSDQSEYAEAQDSLIDQAEDDRLRELSNVTRKKSVRFQSPDVVKDVRLFTPGSSQEIEFYDADDAVNFNQQAIQDLIDDQLNYLKSTDDENNFDKDSVNTLVERPPPGDGKEGKESKGPKESSEEKIRRLSEEIDLEYPPELLELMQRPFNSLSEKEKAKLIKLKGKYDEKLRKLKEKQEAKLKKEMEKARKKAEEEEKKAEKARKKEEERLKKQEEKARKEEEKRQKKSKSGGAEEQEEKKVSQSDVKEDAKSSAVLEIKEGSQIFDEQKSGSEHSTSINKVDPVVADLKTDDLQQITSADNNLQEMQKPKDNAASLLAQTAERVEEKRPSSGQDKSSTSGSTAEESSKSQASVAADSKPIAESTTEQNVIAEPSVIAESNEMHTDAAKSKSADNEKPVKKPRTKKLSPKKLSAIDNQREEEKQEISLPASSKNKPQSETLLVPDERSADLSGSTESLASIGGLQAAESNGNLLEMESIRGLSPTAKLSNKLFKRASLEDTSAETSRSLPPSRLDNLPLIILPAKEKSATLDDRLLRRGRSPKLTSVEQLDFHHLDNVGCLDGSIKNYFNNFLDSSSDIAGQTGSKPTERRSISPTPTSTRAHRGALDVPLSRSTLKRHTISAKRSPPAYLDSLRSQLNTLSNAELSFFASQIKENKLKPPAPSQLELINKSLLSAFHRSELSVSTPCLSELIRPQTYSPFTPYIPSIDRHLSTKSHPDSRLMPIRKFAPIQMPLLNLPIDLRLKTESMPSLSRTASVRPFLRQSIRTLTRPPAYHRQFVYNETGDVFYRDTIYQLKRIEEQLKRLKEQYDSTASLSMMAAKSCLSRAESRKVPEPTTYKYHCTINLIKDSVDVKPPATTEQFDLSDQSRTKVYFRIYKQLGCNHVGSRDLTTKIQEHEDEFRAFCPPYVCVLCYYTVIAIHFLMKQGYEIGEAIEMVRKKQDKEREDRWKHRSTTLIDSRRRLSPPRSYLPSYSSRCKSPVRDHHKYDKYDSYIGSSSNVCHQATTHLNHQRHYSYERSHEPKYYHRDEYLSYKSSLAEQRPKSPSSLRLDCSSPTSGVNRNACNSLYHSSYRTTYSKRFQSDYMKRKSMVDPFLKDTNLRKAELMWKLKNNA